MQIVYKMFCDITRGHLKVRRSRNKVVELKLLQINELTNLYFYPDDLETWISISSFKYFQTIRIKKQTHLFDFWEKYEGGLTKDRQCALFHKLNLLSWSTNFFTWGVILCKLFLFKHIFYQIPCVSWFGFLAKVCEPSYYT